MPAKRLVALFVLLLPAMLGCQSLPVVRQPDSSEGASGLRNLAGAAEDRLAVEQQVTLAQYEEPLPMPPLPVDQGGEQVALTLTDLEELAFQNNPTLMTAAARMETARGRMVQAGLYPNPVVGYQGTEIGNQGSSGQQGGFFSQRVITGGKRQLDQAIAGSEIDEAHFRLHTQEQRVLTDVRVRFFETLVAQRRLELTEELVRIGDGLVTATETLLDARQTTENDLLQAEIRAENTHLLVDNARNESIEAWRRLAAVVGVPQIEKKPLEGELDAELPGFEWDDCYDTLLANHPELNAAWARVERARTAIIRAKREPIPNVDLLVSARHIDLTDSAVANVQVGVPLPIFDGNQGNILSAEADLLAAMHEVKRIEFALQDRFAVIFRRYTNARQQAERYGQRIIPKAERSLRLVTEGYEKGQVQYLTLLTSQQTFLEVSLSHLDSLRELWRTTAMIQGRLLSESLADRS